MTSRIAPTLRIVLAYGLTALLLCLLDAGRLVPMLERLAGDNPQARQAAFFLRDAAAYSGFANLTQIESRLLSSMTIQQTIGAIAEPERTEQQTAERPDVPEGNQAEEQQSTATIQADSPAPSPVPSDGTSLLPAEPQQADIPEKTALPAHTKPKVLIIGDSMIMEGFGPVLHRTLRQRGDMDVIREGRYSTGLSRTDFFDWPKCLTELVKRDKPDLIIICMGANDGQDIIDAKGKRHHADSASWGEIYRARADALVAIATSQGSQVLWVGLPIMGKPSYSKRIRRLSAIQQAACDAVPLATFANTEAALADAAGNYITFLTDDKGRHIRLRYKDMVHVTEDGGKLLTESVVPQVEKALQRKKPSAPADTVAQTPPAVPEPKKITLPGWRELSLYSQARKEQVTYEAFVPTDARPDERFPALYLLHGAYEDSRAWAREMADILPNLATSLRMVLIAPTSGRMGWYLDSPLVPTNQMESFIIQELLPHAEANLPLSQKRSVLGISMGGHGAFILALRHPELFTSVSSMSGVLDIRAHPKQWGIKSLLGPLESNRALWETYSATSLIEHLPADQRLPALLVTVGRDDPYVVQENRAIRDLLRRRGALYQYQETPGAHDWTYWRGEMPHHASFHAEKLRQ